MQNTLQENYGSCNVCKIWRWKQSVRLNCEFVPFFSSSFLSPSSSASSLIAGDVRSTFTEHFGSVVELMIIAHSLLLISILYFSSGATSYDGYQFLYRKTCNVNNVRCSKCNALRYLLPFIQFKKREKRPWSITFSKVAKRVGGVGLNSKITQFMKCIQC